MKKVILNITICLLSFTSYAQDNTPAKSIPDTHSIYNVEVGSISGQKEQYAATCYRNSLQDIRRGGFDKKKMFENFIGLTRESAVKIITKQVGSGYSALNNTFHGGFGHSDYDNIFVDGRNSDIERTALYSSVTHGYIYLTYEEKDGKLYVSKVEILNMSDMEVQGSVQVWLAFWKLRLEREQNKLEKQ